jgi:osmotically inducible protein OsmC
MEMNMPVRSSTAEWHGTLKEGSGRMTIGHDASERPYTFASRFETGKGSNPEELIAAAHAGCFSMALSGRLTSAGHTPKAIRTSAKVAIEPVNGGMEIRKITLESEAEVPGISADEFQNLAKAARDNCPVSKALKSVEIVLRAKLA